MKTLITIITVVLLVGCATTQTQKIVEPPSVKVEVPDIPIHEAVLFGNIEAVKQHLAAGTDVNAKEEEEGMTPLIVAVGEGHKKIIELLIANGADVNAKSDMGTPLHLAAGFGHNEIAKLLIAKGAEVDAKDWEEGMTPLILAVADGYKKIIELLIANGADVNAQSEMGTPLHLATNFGRNEIAKLLISKSADVNAMDDDGKTPLDWAEGETADLLRKHGGKTGSELKAEGK
jgi:ankyrin repeat protein